MLHVMPAPTRISSPPLLLPRGMCQWLIILPLLCLERDRDADAYFIEDPYPEECETCLINFQESGL